MCSDRASENRQASTPAAKGGSPKPEGLAVFKECLTGGLELLKSVNLGLGPGSDLFELLGLLSLELLEVSQGGLLVAR